MINGLLYAFRQAGRQVVRNRAMTVASVFSITAMLLILGLFFVVIVNVDMAAESAKDDYDTIQVYLLDETDQAGADAIVNSLGALEGVSECYYYPKEQAMIDWKAEWGESGYLLDNLSENPLPNSVIINVSELEAADGVAAAAQNMAGVEDVKYYKETVDKLVKITDSVQYAGLIIMAFLIIVSVVVVANTIKLTVFARHKEIEIMKYIGATNWFIRGPFLLEGVLIGLISAAVSSCLAAFVYDKIIELIGNEMLIMMNVQLVPVEFMTFNLVIIFIALGVSIGACGSIISMRRFLDTK